MDGTRTDARTRALRGLSGPDANAPGVNLDRLYESVGALFSPLRRTSVPGSDYRPTSEATVVQLLPPASVRFVRHGDDWVEEKGLQLNDAVVTKPRAITVNSESLWLQVELERRLRRLATGYERRWLDILDDGALVVGDTAIPGNLTPLGESPWATLRTFPVTEVDHRAIRIRRHGDGARVEVEDPPVILEISRSAAHRVLRQHPDDPENRALNCLWEGGRTPFRSWRVVDAPAGMVMVGQFDSGYGPYNEPGLTYVFGRA